MTPHDRAVSLAARLGAGPTLTIDKNALVQAVASEVQAASNIALLECRAKHGPPTVKMQRIHPAAVLPTRKSGDAGYDMYAVEPLRVFSGGFARLPIGWNIEIPWGWWAKIECRSGLANGGFFTTGGVLDPSYRGEPKVFLHWLPEGAGRALGREAYHDFKPGDRIAQMLVLPVFQGGIEEITELSATERGDKGFGSTGR